MMEKICKRTLIGVLTPSSNTVLEPLTSAMLNGLDDVSAHFGRFRVKEISMSETALGQFDKSAILAAAELLADAKVNSIVWSGTSAGWLGFDADRELCTAITDRTGIPTGTSVLALNRLFEQNSVKRFGLVTPYEEDIQERIVANYETAGFRCVAERHFGVRDNFSFSEFSEQTIADNVREVAQSNPDAITVFCTNMRGAPTVAQLEEEIGVPVYDTVATAVWAGMQLGGEDPRRINGWGQLFDRNGQVGHAVR